MMNTLYIKGEITGEAVMEYIDRLTIMESDTITIYLTSEGGDMYATNILKDYIENNLEQVDIVISGYAISAAWRFVLTLKNVRDIRCLDLCYSQDHLSWIGDVSGYGAKTNYDKSHKLMKEAWERDKVNWSNLCKNEFGYTKEELEDLVDGKEVFFNSDRIVEILKNATFHRKT